MVNQGLRARPTKTYKLLAEAFARVEIEKLAQRIADLKVGADSGRLGPRTVRARRRYLENDRRQLCLKLRKLGFKL